MSFTTSVCGATEPLTLVDSYTLLRLLLSELGTEIAPPVGRADELAEREIVRGFRHWSQWPQDVEYHGVTCLVAPIVGALGKSPANPIPDEVRRTLSILASRRRAGSIARERCVDRLLSACSAAGVRVVLLKGTALAHLIYPSPELRPMSDIDIMIDADDVDKVVRIVEGIGYTFAAGYPTRFRGRNHHLPVASTTEDGFRIPLEIHTDAMSPDQPYRLTMRNLSAPLRSFQRGSGPAGLALGHADTLRHLVRHAVEPIRQIRLIHLYDIWRYQAIFKKEIDWREIKARFPYVLVVLQLLRQVFPPAPLTVGPMQAAEELHPEGLGLGMMPLSDIAASRDGTAAKLSAIFSPPSWWLHGFYGVPLERSLWACRTVRHPITVTRWLLRRWAAGSGLLKQRDARHKGLQKEVRQNSRRFEFPVGTSINRMSSAEQRYKPTTTKIDCLMGTYGRYALVCESLACFLAQSALSDATLLIYNQHPVPLYFDHPRVRVINEVRKFRSLREIRQRMHDLAEPSAEFLHWWDDDDLYLPWHLDDCLNNIAEHLAWKPARSWMSKRNVEFSLQASNFEGSWIGRANFLKSAPIHPHPEYPDHPVFLQLKDKGMLATTELGGRTSYIYRWDIGTPHLSSYGGVANAKQQRINIDLLRRHGDDVGAEGCLVPADLTLRWRQFLDGTKHLVTADEWEANRRSLGL